MPEAPIPGGLSVVVGAQRALPGSAWYRIAENGDPSFSPAIIMTVRVCMPATLLKG